MNGCQTELTGNLQIKREKYVINVNFYNENGERKPKQISTGLSTKGYNKRLADDLKDWALHLLNNDGADLEYVKSIIKKQAKVGNVPEVRKPHCQIVATIGHVVQTLDPFETAPVFRGADDIGNAESIPGTTTVLCEKALELSGDHGIGGENGETDNPFVVPEKIREIVALTPSPKIYGDSNLLGDSIPLVTYLKNWMSGQKHHVNHNTYASYDTQMTMRIIPFFEFFGLSLSDLSHHHVNRFYDYVLDAPRLDGKTGKVSSTTVHRVHSVFHKAINQAFFDEYIVSNPLAKVHPPREKVFIPQYYASSQITTFLKHAKGDIAEIPLVLSFFFGTRRSETLGIKEAAINFETNVIYINHTVNVGQRKYDFVDMDEQGLVKKDILKTKKSYRTLPVPDVFMLFLKRLVDRNAALRMAFGSDWNPDGYLCVRPDGKIIHPNVVSRHYKMVARKAGLPENRLHDARHSIASLMIQNGTDIYILKDYLGHADIQTTTRYAHLRSQHLIAPANKVQELIAFDGLSDIV